MKIQRLLAEGKPHVEEGVWTTWISFEEDIDPNHPRYVKAHANTRHHIDVEFGVNIYIDSGGEWDKTEFSYILAESPFSWRGKKYPKGTAIQAAPGLIEFLKTKTTVIKQTMYEVEDDISNNPEDCGLEVDHPDYYANY